MPASQAGRRGFDPRLPLFHSKGLNAKTRSTAGLHSDSTQSLHPANPILTRVPDDRTHSNRDLHEDNQKNQIDENTTTKTTKTPTTYHPETRKHDKPKYAR